MRDVIAGLAILSLGFATSACSREPMPEPTAEEQRLVHSYLAALEARLEHDVAMAVRSCEDRERGGRGLTSPEDLDRANELELAATAASNIASREVRRPLWRNFNSVFARSADVGERATLLYEQCTGPAPPSSAAGEAELAALEGALDTAIGECLTQTHMRPWP